MVRGRPAPPGLPGICVTEVPVCAPVSTPQQPNRWLDLRDEPGKVEKRPVPYGRGFRRGSHRCTGPCPSFANSKSIASSKSVCAATLT
jgi:hypothetical protein